MEASGTSGVGAQRPIVVVGGGLAGHTVAWALATRGARVLHLIDTSAPTAGAAAAGLANPRMGPRAVRAWRADEALDALDQLAAALPPLAPPAPALLRGRWTDALDRFAWERFETDLRAGAPVQARAIVRPATDAAQAARFGSADPPRWVGPGEAGERWPWLAAPHGALLVPDGRVASIPRLTRWLREATPAPSLPGRLVGWRDDDPTGLVLNVRLGDETHEIPAATLVLCPGADALPQGPPLPLHRVGGQTVRVDRPAAVPADAPAVAGRRYAVPAPDGTDAWVVGASHVHDPHDQAPDAAVDEALLAAIAAYVPSLAGANVLGRTAGVRAHVPDTVRPGRLPLAGPWGSARVWVLAGLGGRGLMTAPLLARWLADALLDGAPLPREVSTDGLPSG